MHVSLWVQNPDKEFPELEITWLRGGATRGNPVKTNGFPNLPITE